MASHLGPFAGDGKCQDVPSGIRISIMVKLVDRMFCLSCLDILGTVRWASSWTSPLIPRPYWLVDLLVGKVNYKVNHNDSCIC